MKLIKWSEKQLFSLKKLYANGKKKEILDEIDKSWTSILSKANRLGLKREILEIKNVVTLNWSAKEIEILRTYYSDLEKIELEKLLKRSWVSIQQKAFALKLKRTIKYSDLSSLCENSPEAYYWIGFLMADGHFSKTGVLQINLSKKDKSHLRKFANFVKYKGKLHEYKNYISFTSMDMEIFNVLKNKFGILSDKTHNPCIINNIKNEKLLFSLIAGFIDGDGSIHKSYGRTSLAIKCHYSWFENLEFMLNVLCDGDKKTYKTRINKDNLAYFFITDLSILKKIKEKVLELNLPVLKRKWDNIDLNKETKLEFREKFKKICLDKFKKGLKPKEILKDTKVSSSFCYKLWKEYNES